VHWWKGGHHGQAGTDAAPNPTAKSYVQWCTRENKNLKFYEAQKNFTAMLRMMNKHANTLPCIGRNVGIMVKLVPTPRHILRQNPT
jgi:hypothetical protein